MRVLILVNLITMTLLAPMARAGNFIGVLTDGYQKDCTVHSNGDLYDCSEAQLLHFGDMVTKKPSIDALKVKWAPYAKGNKVDRESMVVDFVPPRDKKDLIGKFKEFLGLVKTAPNNTIMASRGADDGIPQLKDNATVMAGQKSIFPRGNPQDQYILFVDQEGHQVCRKAFDGKPYLELAPEEMGLKPGFSYRWIIVGATVQQQKRLRMLSAEVTRQVADDLALIEKDTASRADKLIEKAFYLQLMSDLYPKEIDLYWLSYNMLREAKKAKNLDDNGMFNILLGSYQEQVSK